MILASKALWSKNNRKMTDGLGRCFESVFFEEIIECDNLKVLYDAIRRRIRMDDEKFTAFFYKNIDWWNGGFEGQTPFFQMGTE